MSLISQHVVKKRRKEEELIVGEAANEGKGLDWVDEPRSKKKGRKRSVEENDASSERKKKTDEDDEKEMKSLESFLFGSLYSPIEFGKEGDGEERGEEIERAAAPLFIMDKLGDDEMVVYEEDRRLVGEEDKKRDKERKPVWVDDEEEEMMINIAKVPRLRKLRKEANETVISGAEYVSRLRALHSKLNPGTDWARIDRKTRVHDSDEESDDDSGVTVAHGYEGIAGEDDLVVKSGVKLLPGLLEYSRLVDANAEEPSNGPITSVEFHRNGQLLLTAGLDKRLRFFQVDGKRNTKVESIFIEDCPVRKASFLPDGSQVIMVGRRKFFYSLDLVKVAVDKIGPLTGRDEKSLENFEISPDSSIVAFIGKEGYILLVSSRTKELIGTLKMNGTARSLAFADGGQQLLSSGGDGHVYHWDLRTRRCIHKAIDEGCIGGSALCTSPDSSLFAAGSSSGIVNVYNRDDFLGGKRKPLKTIENLTTKIEQLKFNHDGQILAITSSMERKGLKLIHVPSFNVFSNWPAGNTSLQHPRCLDFSPGGGFMATGNAAGKVLLYKLHHYGNA